VFGEVADAAFISRRRTPLGRRWAFHARGRPVAGARAGHAVRTLWRAQQQGPVVVAHDGRHAYWWFEERFYREDEDLDAGDVLALVRAREQRARRRVERARAAHAAGGAAARREPIPRSVRLAVFERDGGRCVRCGARFDLQFDHVIPHSLGGAGGAANLQLLCGDCNRRKGAGVG
jgi:hypothetical protein